MREKAKQKKLDQGTFSIEQSKTKIIDHIVQKELEARGQSRPVKNTEEFLELVPENLLNKINDLQGVYKKIDNQYIDPKKLKQGNMIGLNLEQGMKKLLKVNLTNNLNKEIGEYTKRERE